MSITSHPRRSLRDLVGHFAKAGQGNVAIVFAFSLIPIVGMVGLGVDYGVALTDKSKLDNAADAASLAAVVTAKAFVAANPNDANVTSDAIAAGLAQAASSFTVNAGRVPFATPPTVSTFTTAPPSPSNCASGVACIYLTKTNQTFASTTVFNTSTQNHFGQIFGYPTINVTGSAAATGDLPSYLDFYLLADVSGSMGLPATSAGLTALANVNNDMYSDYQQGCQFACHFPTFNGWNSAEQNGIKLRSDSVNSAICSLITTATANAVVANQFRMGLYPFINQMATLSPLTQTLSTISAKAHCSSDQAALTNLLDTGTTQLSTNNDPSTGTGSGGTHFETIFGQMQSTISSYGTGITSTQSKPFVFLITDGMQNSQHFYTWANGKYTYPGNPQMVQNSSPSNFVGYNTAWWDGSQPAVMDPSTCTALKNAGATISVLAIPYLQIVFKPVQNSGVAAENNQVNSFSPSVPNALQSCASPGFFYVAYTPQDITNALNAMFNQATQVAHLTH